MYSSAYVLIFVVSFGVLYSAYRRYSRISIADIPGPKPDSYLLGSSNQLLLPECGVTEARWQEEFGSIFRFKASLGEDRLYVADPRALQHILQRGGYTYRKLTGDGAANALLGGRGLSWAEGDIHRRYRKATAGLPEAISFLPVFHNTIAKVVAKWKDLIAEQPHGQKATVDIPSWMSRSSLDVMGKAAFDYDFGAVDEIDNPLKTSYQGLMASAFGAPSDARTFFENIHNDFPAWLIALFYEYVPSTRIKKLRANRAQVHNLLNGLIQDKKQENLEGKKDVMSLLVKASLDNDRSAKMADAEIIQQITTTLFGGHETVSISVTWLMYEVAKRPEIQARMRAEIQEMKKKVLARGEEDFTALDLEGMHYTVAVMRECLRLQSASVRISREATKDDVLPLHKPVVTQSGKTINEIPIPKGTRLFIATQGYHINSDVWGDDVEEFKPERWLVNRDTTGLFGNVLTFSSGIRSCPGRKFAFVEMQAIMVALIANFEMRIPATVKRVIRHRSIAMVPILEEDLASGVQLPVEISLVAH